MTGRMGYFSGLHAEDAVAADYRRQGFTVAARRWRGPGGEIDLILRQNGRVVFVEVKKSRKFDTAAERVSPLQIERLMASAAAFLDGEPRGADTEARFDVALVDATGRVKRMENALMR